MKIVKELVLIENIQNTSVKQAVNEAKEEVLSAICNIRTEGKAGFYFNPRSVAQVIEGRRVCGNGVKPIKEPFLTELKSKDWENEFPAQTVVDVVVSIKEIKKIGKSKKVLYGLIQAIDRENETLEYLDKQGHTQEVRIDSEFDSLISDKELIGKLVSMKTASPGNLDLCKLFDDQLVAVEWETGNISSSHRALNKMTMLIQREYIAAGFLVVPNRKMGKFITDRIGNYEELRAYFPLWSSIPVSSGGLYIIVVEHDGLDKTAPFLNKGRDGMS